MNIMVIGHKGYLGRGLVSYLEPRHRVLGWDKEEDIFNLNSNILSREKIDLIINLSVMADRQSTLFQLDSPTDRVNVESARHLARILRGSQISWCQISTREVFGLVYGAKDVIRTKNGYKPKFLVDETCPYAPPNCYAKSKLIAEIISESHPFSNVIRLSTCYTDFDHPGGNWVLQMIKNALQGKTIQLTQRGLLFRDPLHINDLGSLIERLTQKRVYSEKLNAGGGSRNLISLIDFLRTAVPKAHIKLAHGKDYGFAFDNRKAFRLTGWKPEILVREKIPVIVKNVLQGFETVAS